MSQTPSQPQRDEPFQPGGVDSRALPGGPSLTAADAAALDALLGAGFEVSRVAAEHRARAARVGSLVSLLGRVEAGDRALVDVTVARVRRESDRAAATAAALAGLHGDAALCRDDEESLDAWVMAGYAVGGVPASLRARAHRHDRLATLVTASGASADAGGRGSLIARTLARVEAEADAERVRLMVAPGPRRRATGLRLADLISVAAVLLIASALIGPLVGTIRENARRAACLGNFGSIATALGAYAGANQDSLPVVTASLGGVGGSGGERVSAGSRSAGATDRPTWWNVGRDPQHSNSANLYSLARNRYVPLQSLACPGNPHAPTAIVDPAARDWRDLSEVSYSFQIMLSASRPAWEGSGGMVVLADRSPVILKAILGQPYDPGANAPNHGGRGQHALRTDGSASWLRSPVLGNGDNIWLPRSIEERIRLWTGRPSNPEPLSGTETPEGADDVFLGP